MVLRVRYRLLFTSHDQNNLTCMKFTHKQICKAYARGNQTYTHTVGKPSTDPYTKGKPSLCPHRPSPDPYTEGKLGGVIIVHLYLYKPVHNDYRGPTRGCNNGHKLDKSTYGPSYQRRPSVDGYPGFVCIDANWMAATSNC